MRTAQKIFLGLLMAGLLGLLCFPWKGLGNTPAAALGGKQGPLGGPVCYVSILGAKQGYFKGMNAKTHRFPVLGLTYEVISPRDPATGLPTGKRQHKPLTITKEWGAASPQIFEALVTNENLKGVLIEFLTPSGALDHVIRLFNASVSGYRHYPNNGLKDGTTDKYQLEDASFTFQHIEFEDTAGKTFGSDDLKQ
jgi:type VI secretion system secreted protein Hcp